MYRTFGIVALSFALLGTACEQTPSELAEIHWTEVTREGEALPLVRLRSEPAAFTAYSGLEDSVRIVVRDTESWSDVWAEIWERAIPQPTLPEVDFSRDMLVVAALGQRSSLRYDRRAHAARRHRTPSSESAADPLSGAQRSQ